MQPLNDWSRGASAPTLPGLHVGEVTAVEDPEHMGRIQVQVPSVFGSEAPESHAWARPCFTFGHFFVPEVGSKVWLAFENGDPSRPVWLGIWYPQGEAPSEAQVSPPSVRMIVTASGHRVIFNDSVGEESLLIEDAQGNAIELRADAVRITAGADLTIDAAGNNVVIQAASVDVQG